MTIGNKVKLILLAGVFILLAAIVASGAVNGIDVVAVNYVYSLRSEILTRIMLGVSFLGSAPFISIAAIIFVLAFWIKRYKNEAIILAATLLSSVAIDNALKYFIRRGRPDVAALDTGITYSFPSGHAMNSLVFYGLLAYFAPRWIKNRRALFAVDAAAIILVALIGFSRIYLGAHYLTDVVAGWVAGLVVLGIAKTAQMQSGEVKIKFG